jgi:hypothetical protein
MVPAHLAEPLPEGHFYLHDVIGLRAVTADGEELGIVTDVLRSPANDVYVAGSLLIPAVKAVVDRIDPAAGLLVVHSKDALATVEVGPERDEARTRSPQRHRDTEKKRRQVTISAGQAADRAGQHSGDSPDSAPP